MPSPASPGPIALMTPEDLEGGGAQLVTLRLAEGLAKAGLPVEVVVARSGGDFQNRVPEGVSLHDLESREPVFLWKMRGLARYLRTVRPRVFISSLDVAGAAVWAKQLTGVDTPVVLWEHINLTRQFDENYGPVGGFIRKKLFMWSRPRADAVVTVSRGVADDLERLTPVPAERLHVAYNPVVTPEMLAQANEPVDHPWLTGDGPPVVLGVGRLTEQKDFPTLIRALARAQEERPVRLILLGQPDKGRAHVQADLEALATRLGVRKLVDFAGFKQNPYAYMAAADALALSSIYEGLPTVLIEALATGTPVVATDCPSGPLEILDDGKFGPLVPVRDPEALAKGILQVLGDPLPSEVLRERAMRFSLEESVQDHLEVLAALAPSLAQAQTRGAAGR